MYTERIDVPASDAADLQLVAARAQCRALTAGIENELRTVKCAVTWPETLTSSPPQVGAVSWLWFSASSCQRTAAEALIT